MPGLHTIRIQTNTKWVCIISQTSLTLFGSFTVEAQIHISISVCILISNFSPPCFSLPFSFFCCCYCSFAVCLHGSRQSQTKQAKFIYSGFSLLLCFFWWLASYNNKNYDTFSLIRFSVPILSHLSYFFASKLNSQACTQMTLLYGWVICLCMKPSKKKTLKIRPKYKNCLFRPKIGFFMSLSVLVWDYNGYVAKAAENVQANKQIHICTHMVEANCWSYPHHLSSRIQTVNRNFVMTKFARPVCALCGFFCMYRSCHWFYQTDKPSLKRKSKGKHW